ncbi:MAG: hypothetical protein ABR571_07075 [Jatrophihabitans sp.]|uniref:hypothetical protein n=1 Tax=Jatrophihabitans sp. TaxID=1932789 RepID=UPI003914D741
MTAVDDFLKAIEKAAIDSCDAWSADCVMDATVPNWRFRSVGADAIRSVYGEWFAYPSVLVDLRRWIVPDGEIIEYVHRFRGEEGPLEAHHLHVLQLKGARIVADTVFCGGQWSAAQLAEMRR